MNIFSGLEKFGLKSAESVQLFEDNKKSNQQHAHQQDDKQQTKPAEQEIPPEKDFILEKTIRCKVCDQVFKTKVVKNGRVKRLEPDRDLRPRFQYIDTLKYDITSCPFCGYTAMNRYFDMISSGQIKLIREQIASQFQPKSQSEEESYSYDTAVDRYKLSLLNTVVKRGRDSEKAFTCLKLSWLLRGKVETMSESTAEEKQVKQVCEQEQEEFYQQAFEGFQKAIAGEMFPMCGMEQCTVDYLLACMAFHFKKYEIASKFLQSVLTSVSASRRMKDMALELKDDIIAELRK